MKKTSERSIPDFGFLISKGKSVGRQVHRLAGLTRKSNENGHLLNYEEFLYRFNIPITPKEFAIVFDTIPSGVIRLFQMTPYPSILPSLDPTISVLEKQCFSASSSNKSIRLLFLNDFVSIPNVTFIGIILSLILPGGKFG